MFFQVGRIVPDRLSRVLYSQFFTSQPAALLTAIPKAAKLCFPLWLGTARKIPEKKEKKRGQSYFKYIARKTRQLV